YLTLGKYSKALANYNKAIELKPDYADSYFNRGYFYQTLEKYSKALTDYDKAIELKPDYADAYNNRGSAYLTLGKYSKALTDYNKVIKLNPNDAMVYRARANLHDILNKKESAEKDREKADVLYKMQGYDKKLSLYVEETEIKNTETKPSDENKELKKLMGIIEKYEIDKESKDVNKDFKEQLLKESVNDSLKYGFWVLRRWNSYTPILNSKVNSSSKGGGYFFKTKDCGIVIDPGFNFIENFTLKKFLFREIDHIFITHAHNDHTADLESLLTLLYKHNDLVLGDIDEVSSPDEELRVSNKLDTQTQMQKAVKDWVEKWKALKENKGKKDGEWQKIIQDDDGVRSEIKRNAKEKFKNDPRRKRISLYMTASTYKKYAPMLELKAENDYKVIIIKTDDTIQLKDPNEQNKDNYSKNIHIKVIPANHDDILSDRDSVGFVIRDEDTNFALVYTGDTGYDVKMNKVYSELKSDLAGKKIFLLAHLGGFKLREKPDYSKDIEGNKRYFNKNHLGRMGMVFIIKALQPDLCIISEFGEEFLNHRVKLRDAFRESFEKFNTVFLAADIGLHFNTEGKICAITEVDVKTHIATRSFISPADVDIKDNTSDSTICYFAKGVDATSAVLSKEPQC
ncbi:MAG: tetratricopeptide repeat protein, partial [Nitrososphaerota archaeon]|nr:tetratricopeptide repeat protein [Nitrososphaerota archaeon]